MGTLEIIVIAILIVIFFLLAIGWKHELPAISNWAIIIGCILTLIAIYFHSRYYE